MQQIAMYNNMKANFEADPIFRLNMSETFSCLLSANHVAIFTYRSQCRYRGGNSSPFCVPGGPAFPDGKKQPGTLTCGQFMSTTWREGRTGARVRKPRAVFRH